MWTIPVRMKAGAARRHEMPILGKLVQMYRAEGIDICTGLSCYFENSPYAQYTRFIKNGQNITNGLGIAMQEVYLLEHIFSSYHPRHIIIIGNSQGWSTLAISLLSPESRVVAIDSGSDENSLQGLDLTNRIASLAGLGKVRAVKGVSPQDVGAIVDSELGGRVDFAFIDGYHTNDQIVLDFQAVSPTAAEDAVYLFHDVLFFSLYDGIARIEALAGLTAQILTSTPSGMALLYDPTQHPELKEAVTAFAPMLEARTVVKGGVREHLMKHTPKRRFIVLDVLRRLAEAKLRFEREYRRQKAAIWPDIK
jgi:predicted O-methyltransferase YrrM